MRRPRSRAVSSELSRFICHPARVTPEASPDVPSSGDHRVVERQGDAMPRSDFRSAVRVLSSCVLAAVIVAACSSDNSSDSTTATTAPGETSAPATDAPAGTDTTPSTSNQGLTVGVLVPPPGLLETLFEGQLRGINDAAADIKAGGGVLGGELTVNQIATPLGSTEA